MENNMTPEQLTSEAIKRGIRSPYGHELSPSGDACADNCPACIWTREELPTIIETASPNVNPLLRMAEVTPCKQK